MADALGQKLLVVKANGENDIGAGFATIVQQKVGGLVVISDPFLISQRERLVALAALHALPAIYPLREYAVAGGLMSYGASLSVAYRAGFSTATSLRVCPCSNPPRSSWFSISKPLKPSASLSRSRYSTAPTR